MQPCFEADDGGMQSAGESAESSRGIVVSPGPYRTGHIYETEVKKERKIIQAGFVKRQISMLEYEGRRETSLVVMRQTRTTSCLWVVSCLLNSYLGLAHFVSLIATFRPPKAWR